MFITDEIDTNRLSYPLFKTGLDEKTLILDIETSGMSFDRSHVTVIGAASVRDGKVFFFQWFADRPGSESFILTDFLSFISEYDTLVTYNGQGFDVPYLNKRAALHALPSRLSSMEHIDLFKYSKPFADLYGLPNRKLKTIESGLFIERDDKCSGADCIDLYRGYLQTGDASLRDLILLHNKEDIINLIDVMHIRSYHALMNGSFQVAGSQVSPDAALTDCPFTIHCKLGFPVPRKISLSTPFHEITAENDAMAVIFKGSFCEKKLFRKDYKNYYYLKNEDCAIHKSVGQFVDRSCREQAKASNCYERAEAIFFEQPEEIIRPVFKDSYKGREFFFRADDISAADPDLLKTLCLSALQFCVR